MYIFKVLMQLKDIVIMKVINLLVPDIKKNSMNRYIDSHSIVYLIIVLSLWIIYRTMHLLMDKRMNVR